MSSLNPSSRLTFGAKPSVVRARAMSAVLWRMSKLPAGLRDLRFDVGSQQAIQQARDLENGHGLARPDVHRKEIGARFRSSISTRQSTTS